MFVICFCIIIVPMDVRTILEQLDNGAISVEEAQQLLMQNTYAEMEFAKLDTGREARSGFPEVVFCERKADQHLASIYKRLYEENGEVFGTRASAHQFEVVREVLPEVTYDGISRILKTPPREKEFIGLVAVCTAGTADIPVAEEAAQTAEYFGTRVERFYDIGVSGIHRLFDRIEEIRRANCVIAAAGMEGALVSVLGGQVSRPVIGVPTSVGYGVGKDGHAALYSMLTSCANGIATVNIDNGYGAGYIATQINRLAVGAGEHKRTETDRESCGGATGRL